MEDHNQYISNMKTLSYRSKNINNPQAEKEKKNNNKIFMSESKREKERVRDNRCLNISKRNFW